MTGSRMTGFSLLCVVVATLLGAPAASGAASRAVKPQNVTLVYDIYFGGVQGLQLKVKLALDGNHYDVKTELRTGGMISRIVPWSLNAYSKGLLQGPAVTPLVAGHSSVWRGKSRSVDMSFTDGGAKVTRIEPPPGDDERNRVPAELLKNARDLASTILSISRSMKTKDGCDHRLPVFDGRRRYDLVLNQLERARMAPSQYSPFQGVVLICRAEIDRISGFKSHDGSDDDDAHGRAVLVAIGKVFDDLSPMPVRVDFQSRFGAVIAHLARARSTSGGKTRALSY